MPRTDTAPTTLVDSCVIFDLLTEDPRWSAWSENALADAADEGPLAINPLIYAEISADFTTIEELDEALPPSDYRREPLPWEAGFLAGQAFLLYRRRGGAKRSPIADFYIGAHAAVRGYRILTRDTRRYSSYFPTVPLISPG
ncbi:type II toxin-antitoxin system VapC family toxin [Nocardia terpenica]|uniref:type II toxin-antitoxin system VapC family toxin n=1 Tax=Nocardia terpenica TaxID=455432 RepID=UPI0018956203|nr:type II toxin-antitoxin system VapC family toxin [Nocardia terpenica]MBF6060985.1 type II toxin-antitoxin system VapC family toxin [Nocardia terpenica]MBF6108803.1 type II toxin-antitoxin system VapC family toxin [Nocardia terpenica]MBF6114011.1 type II toxin-antitoxin system VapC family toxin [Nocardia terpenica]MBF6120365.1 type II toxin-antitoxin system VapC family toxin [Nocardia terpenica]MBF6156324.1 type II toxin-antitoxin system VapC family toxin [Nocardia terpenica]